MKDFALVLTMLCLLGCNDDSVSSGSETVHLAGFLANSGMDGDNTAGYWKDSTYTALTGNGILSTASSLYVDGGSVIIGGWKRAVNDFPKGVIWKDGSETPIEDSFGSPMIVLRNGNLFGVWLGTTGWLYHKENASQLLTDTAANYAPMAMTISGNDMYIAGYSSGPALPPNYSPLQHAQYWKNGRLIFRDTEGSNALSIFTHNNDVYMAGMLYPSPLKVIACYWKNGDRVDLTDGNTTAIAQSIFVTDQHVYVAGMQGDQAVYWKDGEIVYLTTNQTFSMANSIFVKGSDVHVGGYQNWHPAYWKNDVRKNIGNQDKIGQIKFVVVGGSD